MGCGISPSDITDITYENEGEYGRMDVAWYRLVNNVTGCFFDVITDLIQWIRWIRLFHWHTYIYANNCLYLSCILQINYIYIYVCVFLIDIISIIILFVIGVIMRYIWWRWSDQQILVTRHEAHDLRPPQQQGRQILRSPQADHGFSRRGSAAFTNKNPDQA